MSEELKNAAGIAAKDKENEARDSAGNQAQGSSVFTQGDVNNIVARELAKAEKKFSEQLTQRLSEAENLAGMNAEQKANYERERMETEINARLAEVTRRELLISARDTLMKRGLPGELAEALNYTDPETCDKSIDAVSKAFNLSVSKVVDERLRSAAPKTGDIPSPIS